MIEVGVPTEIRMYAWMQLEKPEMTIEEAVAELKELGNEILEIDEKNRRIKVADYTEQL